MSALSRMYWPWRVFCRRFCAVPLLLAGLHAAPALANVVITGTRVIFPAGEHEVTVKLANAGQQPALVQVWMDRGDPASTPDTANVPFALTPPLFRIDPDKGQTLRMTYTQEPLPGDRESVFWLNVLDIPPAPGKAAAGQNTLQFAVRSRLKVFFRPAGLRGSPEAAPGQVQWSLVPGTGKGGYTLQARNPSPYHVSLTEVAVLAGSQRASNPAAGMIEPLGTLSIPLAGLHQPAPGEAVEVDYTFMNDFGVPVSGHSRRSP
jgi:chaperone protein EcpD